SSDGRVMRKAVSGWESWVGANDVYAAVEVAKGQERNQRWIHGDVTHGSRRLPAPFAHSGDLDIEGGCFPHIAGLPIDVMDPPAPVAHCGLNALVHWTICRSLTEGDDIHRRIDRVDGGRVEVARQGINVRYGCPVQLACDCIDVVSLERHMANA